MQTLLSVGLDNGPLSDLFPFSLQFDILLEDLWVIFCARSCVITYFQFKLYCVCTFDYHLVDISFLICLFFPLNTCFRLKTGNWKSMNLQAVSASYLFVACMAFKQRKPVKDPRNKYLRPGALAQIRNNRAASRACIGLGKKKAVLDLVKEDISCVVNCTPAVSPSRMIFEPLLDLSDEVMNEKVPETPKTPQCYTRSRLEALPMELLVCLKLQRMPFFCWFLQSMLVIQPYCCFFAHCQVKILCHMHHDQLRAVFHVCQRIRQAVSLSFFFSLPQIVTAIVIIVIFVFLLNVKKFSIYCFAVQFWLRVLRHDNCIPISKHTNMTWFEFYISIDSVICIHIIQCLTGRAFQS